MVITHEARNISISIDRDWREVYEFAHRPENFGRWASGLAEFLHQEGGEWVAETAEGSVQVRFTPRNEFGVMDHYVTSEPAIEVYVPLRVIANGTGCEVIFTLFRTPGMTDEIMARDAEWVTKDLRALKALVESG
ncbi:MAG: SRPBCC family protein [Acidimicrobiia bacterium]